MKKLLLLMAACFFVTSFLSAQTDTATHNAMPPAFEKMMMEVKSYKPDTTGPPADKITQKIMELRKLRGGFNINEVVLYKLEEDRQKGDLTADAQKKLTDYFTTGNGRRWLDNAVIWVYRNHFTYSELKGLAKFYKSSAGQKMGSDFPAVILESAAAGEMIKGFFEKEPKRGF